MVLFFSSVQLKSKSDISVELKLVMLTTYSFPVPFSLNSILVRILRKLPTGVTLAHAPTMLGRFSSSFFSTLSFLQLTMVKVNIKTNIVISFLRDSTLFFMIFFLINFYVDLFFLTEVKLDFRRSINNTPMSDFNDKFLVL